MVGRLETQQTFREVKFISVIGKGKHLNIHFIPSLNLQASRSKVLVKADITNRSGNQLSWKGKH